MARVQPSYPDATAIAGYIADGRVHGVNNVHGQWQRHVSPIAVNLTLRRQPRADIAITKTDSPDPVNAGANLTYTITVTNNSTAATGVAATGISVS